MMLSIVMLTYNHESYVSKAIDSIVNQKTKYSYELLIGDDCSEDGTGDIIREYAQKYPSIIKPVLRSKNIGLIKNYFDMMARCRGKYIMLCAGDDFWLCNKIEKQISFMEKNPKVFLLHSGYQTVDENGIILRKINRCKKVNFNSLFKGNCIIALSTCFKKSLIDKYVIEVAPVEKDWKMEDYPLWLWISKNGVISYMPEVLCSYRILKGSISHPNNLYKEEEFEKSIYDIRVYFSRNKEDEKKSLDIYKKNMPFIILRYREFKRLMDFIIDNKCIYLFAKELIYRIYRKITLVMFGRY